MVLLSTCGLIVKLKVKGRKIERLLFKSERGKGGCWPPRN